MSTPITTRTDSQGTTLAMNEPLRKQISDLVASHRVLLFMKGNRQAPECGFSAQVVKILDELLPSYETVDMLRSPELREGIKEFSQWPTIPQLYVGGQFIGGCDIVREMNASGELQKLIGKEVSEPKTPTITLSEAATNPNQPASVRELSAQELKAMLDRGEVTLFDVRPEDERAIATIAAARSLDAPGKEYLMGLDRGTPIAFHCHHGIRSLAAAQTAVHEGFTNVYNLKGGIDAWSMTIDPLVPRY